MGIVDNEEEFERIKQFLRTLPLGDPVQSCAISLVGDSRCECCGTRIHPPEPGSHGVCQNCVCNIHLITG